MLRNLFVFGIIAVGICYAFQGAFNVLLFYLWFAYFRPEYWLWDPGLILALNLSFVLGLVLLCSSIGALQRFSWGFRAALLGAFFLQSVLSVIVSEHFDWSLQWWIAFAKTLIVAVIIPALVMDRRRFRWALLVIVYSASFEAAKEGWAQLLLNPGAANTNSNVMLGDNNGVAVGMMMLAPLLIALAQTASRRWERYLHRFFLVGVLYRGISTYSRGGFLTAGVVGLVMLWYSPRKLRAAVMVAALAITVAAVMPPRFWDRMHTMTVSANARDDASEGRLTMWATAVRMANARPVTGIGFNGFEQSFSSYDISGGAFGSNRAVHSAWFGILADMGYPGLLLFVAIIGAALIASARIRAATRLVAASRDLRSYASAMLATFVAYTVGMTFLSGQYLEMFWHLVGLSIALDALATTAAQEQPAITSPSVPRPIGGRRDAAMARTPR